MRRTVYDESYDGWREQVRAFLAETVVPVYRDWEEAHRPPKEFWNRAGEAGILGIGIPEEYGGTPGTGFKHSAIVTEESARVGLALGGIRVHTDICTPYFLELASEEQKQRWLPRTTSGEALLAIAMSEPGAGSDLKGMSTRAVLDGDHYVVNGAKTFISNGMAADLIILAAKTDPDAGRKGISLFVVEGDSEGLSRGGAFDKFGQKAQDLCELFFDDVAVPAENLLGEENMGFHYLTHNLPRERLSIAINSQAAATNALAATVDALARTNGSGRSGAGSGRSGEHRTMVSPGQNIKFELAACAAEVAAGQAFVDAGIEADERGELTAEDAAVAKLYTTELQGRVTDRCLQLLGPEGYTRDHPVGRAFADARVSRIYGGSSEIMKVIVAKSIGL